MIYIQLFYTFFLIGLFGFGGGYAMLSMIQGEVVTNHHWMTMGEFTDIVAVSQMTPGPIGINSATYVGYTAIINAGGSPLPSFVLMLLISKFLMQYKHHPIVEHIFIGLRPAVVGLLGAACLLLMTPENFSTPSDTPWQFWISIAIFVGTMIGCQVYKLNPIRALLFCALVGILLF